MGWREWTGVGQRRWKTTPDEHVEPAKTLWDLLQLLIVPVLLVGISLWWSGQQDRRDKAERDASAAADRVAAEQVRQDATLKDYFQQMSDLVLHERLLASTRGDGVRSVARTVTLTTLRRLNGERKGEVVRFLHEARLIRARGESSVDLLGADLRGVYLTGANLAFANLGMTTFGSAPIHTNFAGAHLSGAILEGAMLRGADFRGADLTTADLAGADLVGAKFRGANLRGAYLGLADLRAADLRGANLTGAYLRDAKLAGAKGVPRGSR